MKTDGYWNYGDVCQRIRFDPDTARRFDSSSATRIRVALAGSTAMTTSPSACAAHGASLRDARAELVDPMGTAPAGVGDTV